MMKSRFKNSFIIKLPFFCLYSFGFSHSWFDVVSIFQCFYLIPRIPVETQLIHIIVDRIVIQWMKKNTRKKNFDDLLSTFLQGKKKTKRKKKKLRMTVVWDKDENIIIITTTECIVWAKSNTQSSTWRGTADFKPTKKKAYTCVLMPLFWFAFVWVFTITLFRFFFFRWFSHRSLQWMWNGNSLELFEEIYYCWKSYFFFILLIFFF